MEEDTSFPQSPWIRESTKGIRPPLICICGCLVHDSAEWSLLGILSWYQTPGNGRWRGERTKEKCTVVTVCGSTLSHRSGDTLKGRNMWIFLGLTVFLMDNVCTNITRHITPNGPLRHYSVIWYVMTLCCVYSASLFLEVSGFRCEEQCSNEMLRDLWTAAEARHKKPQGFIFSPCCSTRGQDWDVKLFLFLSDHFHIWTALVLLCVTESLLSVEAPGLCVASTACARAPEVLQYEFRDKYLCPYFSYTTYGRHACYSSVKVLITLAWACFAWR